MSKFNSFQKWALATLCATLLLIFIGGFVRVSGSGLGCPDWPRCWGSWWPPSSVDVIDREAYPVDEFNFTKMWIEYANRLVGVAVGLLVFGTFILSRRYWKSDRAVVWGSALAVLLVGFEGWLGGMVVESELSGGMVTLHLAGAVILFSVLIWVTWRASGEGRYFELDSPVWRGRMRRFAWVLFVASGLQVLLGARVREQLDLIKKSGVEVASGDLMEVVGEPFYTHRSFAWLLVALGVVAVLMLRRAKLSRLGKHVFAAIPCNVALQVGTGIVLAYFALPGWSQVLHLGLSAVLCCLCFWAILGLGQRDERRAN